ncbi:hypothetical protein GALMADRAFT_208159 [Galerina marginata CBS 339.88]|uniref:Uncharacterized protein n=1 Tax=Galerina marginata (strain CBS 339.88) TaxID=685588 RepID=A0A067TJ03_GALM3|nr:hypothetical protein GALMADRAFT_208159 [Galerina marginata CBS 339.88]
MYPGPQCLGLGEDRLRRRCQSQTCIPGQKIRVFESEVTILQILDWFSIRLARMTEIERLEQFEWFLNAFRAKALQAIVLRASNPEGLEERVLGNCIRENLLQNMEAEYRKVSSMTLNQAGCEKSNASCESNLNTLRLSYGKASRFVFSVTMNVTSLDDPGAGIRGGDIDHGGSGRASIKRKW